MLAVAVGSLMGFIGGGGGFIYVLMLMITFKRPAHEAIGTALILATLTSLTAVISHWRQRNLSWHHASRLALIGAVAAAIGGFITQFIPDTVLKWLVVGLFVVLGMKPLLRLGRKAEEQPADQPKDWKNNVRRVSVAGLVGIAVGSFGMSGGAPLSSYLSTYEGLTAAQSIGTAMIVVTAMSLVGSLAHASFGNMNSTLFALIGCGSMVGAYAGAYLSGKVNQRALMIVLGLLTLLSTIGLITKL
jgi:hypothetical protein